MNKKIKKNLLFLIIILILGIIIYFILNKPVKNIPNQETPSQIVSNTKTLLDERFFMVYGKISKIDIDSLNIEIIKDVNVTDYVFDNMNEINVFINKNIPVQKFDIEKQVYNNLQISNLKIGDFIEIYLNNTITSEYRAVKIEIFEKTIVE
ncbi:MAG: hypothetical protein V1910_02200 [bacterium]